MSRYATTKTEVDVTVHYSDEWGKYMPSINVKCRLFPRVAWMDLGLDEEEAMRLGDIAFEEIKEDFWNQAQVICITIFGKERIVRQCGRSGGWLSIDGLPEPVEHWRRPTVMNWFKFAGEIDRLFHKLTSEEHVKQYVKDLVEDGV